MKPCFLFRNNTSFVDLKLSNGYFHKTSINVTVNSNENQIVIKSLIVLIIF